VQLAANIVAKLNGRPTQPFRFRPKGQLSSIGHNKAVAEVMGLKVSGFIAWLMWRGLYLLRIPTFVRNCRLFFEWNRAMFFPPDIAHFGTAARSDAAQHSQRSTEAAPRRALAGRGRKARGSKLRLVTILRSPDPQHSRRTFK